MTGVVGRRPSKLTWLAAGVLLGLHFALAVGSKLHESTTSDELVHVTGGVSYWKFNDYRLHPENGNLAQRWAALPIVLAGATFPSLNEPYWKTSDVWVLGHEFFYETKEDHFPRLMAARAMIALFSVATGLLVFVWSRALFGTGAAFFSLGLFAFSPVFLAHGGLATSDVCMAFFFLASLGAWWRHLHDPRISSGLLSALTFGLACVAKFSAVLLLPMMALLALARIAAADPLRFARWSFATRRAKLVALLGSGAIHGAVAVTTIWACYGFRFSAFNPAVPTALQFIRRWELVHQNIGLQGKIVQALANLHALPEAFLYGYSYVIESAQSRAAFLNGHYSLTGWPSFFVWTFVLKTTIPVLIVGAMMIAVMMVRWRRHPARARSDLYRVLPLAVLFIVYWAFSITSHLNIGQRHILPTYPVLFIGAGAVVAAFRRWKPIMVALPLLLGGWQAYAAVHIAPDFLAYFNGFAGGPAHAYRHLVDSSLDWGQDLPGLKAWLDEHATDGTPVFLSYFGTGEPAYYQIHARRLVMVNGFKIPQAFVRLEPGIYCISVTALQQVYSPARGPWTEAREEAYQTLRRLEPAFLDMSEHPEHRARWEKVMPRADWERSRERYEVLRFARLCYYLRALEPNAQIGYSINVYRVGRAELEAAVHQDFSTWRDAVQKAIRRRQSNAP